MLLWIDDIASFAEGMQNQLQTLEQVDQFAMDHKLRWGQEKCQVMRVGKHRGETTEWKIGTMSIKETESYKYLGDIVCNDGKNTRNLEARKSKTISNTISIKTMAANEVFREIATPVLLELHETVNLSALLTNSESWNLNKSERDLLEKIEIQAIKQLFDLSAHTPTPALIYTFGLLYTSLRMEQRQLTYMWKVLNRNSQHWTHKVMTHTMEKNIGWGRNIIDTLRKHNLPTDPQDIRLRGKHEWKRMVKKAIEASNKERLMKDLHKVENGEEKRKTKTATIVDSIKEKDYQTTPQTIIVQLSKRETKALITCRYHMLECGTNFKGTHPVECATCKILDDEHHRLNHCIKYREINRYDHDVKMDISDIFSDDPVVVKRILTEVMRTWNLHNANGTMNTE